MTRDAHEKSPAPPEPPARRGLRLVDLLILLAASAFPILLGLTNDSRGLIADASYLLECAGGFEPTSRLWWVDLRHRSFGPGRLIESMAAEMALVLGTILIPSTFAMVLIRLRPPRPDRRELLCQPGFIATVAAGLGMLLIPAGWAYAGRFAPAWVVPAMVTLAWLALAIGRGWRPERSWVDRTGRAVGLAWLAMAPSIVWPFRE
ncbi:hypothetical protein [Tautonia plasticadhaerens]|uniref:Uncharacterized protein n=1 Tax=Tautonia plasticadhaerens TaxID=2527974 RepID=A0A518GWX0_9BACT|nr:hypothetical protein [Tautonia plasticadhaerens]QDV33085.1 hypothetical protein ElP_09270 [Tautonia plasticadhaerens]